MTLGNVYQVASYPLWVDFGDDADTDRYEDCVTLALEQWDNFDARVLNITVDGAGELVIECSKEDAE